MTSGWRDSLTARLRPALRKEALWLLVPVTFFVGIALTTPRFEYESDAHVYRMMAIDPHGIPEIQDVKKWRLLLPALASVGLRLGVTQETFYRGVSLLSSCLAALCVGLIHVRYQKGLFRDACLLATLFLVTPMSMKWFLSYPILTDALGSALVIGTITCALLEWDALGAVLIVLGVLVREQILAAVAFYAVLRPVRTLWVPLAGIATFFLVRWQLPLDVTRTRNNFSYASALKFLLTPWYLLHGAGIAFVAVAVNRLAGAWTAFGILSLLLFYGTGDLSTRYSHYLSYPILFAVGAALVSSERKTKGTAALAACLALQCLYFNPFYPAYTNDDLDMSYALQDGRRPPSLGRFLFGHGPTPTPTPVPTAPP